MLNLASELAQRLRAQDRDAVSLEIRLRIRRLHANKVSDILIEFDSEREGSPRS